MKQTNLMRYHIADYLNVGNSEEPEYALMGIGFTSLNENPNAQEDEKIYINQKSSTTKVKSYNTEFDFNAELIKEEKATMKIYDISRNHKVGAEAIVEYVRVELWEEVEGEENTYKARKFAVSVVVSSNSADGGEPISQEGTLKAVGDFIDGKFNTETREFTEVKPITSL